MRWFSIIVTFALMVVWALFCTSDEMATVRESIVASYGVEYWYAGIMLISVLFAIVAMHAVKCAKSL